MNSDKVLILAAGRGLSMDGIHKLKLGIPGRTERVKEAIERQFGSEMFIVVGYRAAELISEWPDEQFIYNSQWYETGSSFSAKLGLQSMSSVSSITVMPGDLIFGEELAQTIAQQTQDTIFVCNTENQSSKAVNVVISDGEIADFYRGPKRDGNDVEAIGVVKLTSQASVDAVIESCALDHTAYFVEAAMRTNLSLKPVLLSKDFDELNSVEDYYQLWKKNNAQY